MIRINGVEWNVNVITPALSAPNVSVLGLTDLEQCIIDIRQGLPQDRTEQVFFHELMHIVLNNEEESFMHGDEGLVSRVSELLYAVLKDNGMLRSGWFEGLVDKIEKVDTVESKRVIVDESPAAKSDESLRHGDYAEALSASGRNELERYRE